jgi:hypothetical protein
MSNPRTRLSGEYLEFDKVMQILNEMLIKRISNPKGTLPLTNIEVWALARVASSTDFYVTVTKGTIEEPEVIGGHKEFENPLVIPDALEPNHAVTLGQVTQLITEYDTEIRQYINEGFQGLQEQIGSIESNVNVYVDESITTYDISIRDYITEVDNSIRTDIQQIIDDLTWEDVGAEQAFNKGDITVSEHFLPSDNLIGRLVGEQVLDLSLDTSWFNSRYHKRLSLINSQSIFQMAELDNGMHIFPNFAGSSGFPTELGMTTVFYSGNQNIASAQGRMFGIHRSYNTERYYIGSPTILGETNPWREIYHVGNLDLSVYVNLEGEQVITGLKRLRRGTNQSSNFLHTSFEYPDQTEGVPDYALYLKVDGTEDQARFFFSSRMVHNSNIDQNIFREHAMIGFDRFITVIGKSKLDNPEIAVELFNNTSPAYRNNIRLWVAGEMRSEGRGIFGKLNFENLQALPASVSLYSEGSTYSRLGYRSTNPIDGSLFGPAWELGSVVNDPLITPTHRARVRIGGIAYDVLLRQV